MPYKGLKLTGYASCILLPVLLLHVAERAWYRRSGYKWYLSDEVMDLVTGFLSIGTLSFVCNSRFVNDLDIN